MLFGYFDIGILLLVLAFDWIVWKLDVLKRITLLVVLAWAILFFYVFPYTAAEVEAFRVHSIYDNNSLDGFNLLYIWFRWPTWWMIGLVELVILYQILKVKKQENA